MSPNTESPPSLNSSSTLNSMLLAFYDKKFIFIFVVVFIVLYIFFNFIKLLGSIPVLLVLSLLVSYYYYKSKNLSTDAVL